MKTIYTLVLGLALTLSANSQNIILNPGFEDWDIWANTTGLPNNWLFLETQGSTSSAIRETLDVHSGLSSIKVQAPSNTEVVSLKAAGFHGIVGGHHYTISYWYKDVTNNAKGKSWGVWKGFGLGQEIIVENNPLQPSGYFPNTNDWQQVLIDVVAPANAARIDFEFRVAAGTGNSGTILYDDISIIDNEVLGVDQSEISGLNVYPNPVVNGTLFIDTNAAVEKMVTIFDLLGKEVINIKTNANSINVSNLTRGIYILKIIEDKKTATRKIIIN